MERLTQVISSAKEPTAQRLTAAEEEARCAQTGSESMGFAQDLRPACWVSAISGTSILCPAAAHGSDASRCCVLLSTSLPHSSSQCKRVPIGSAPGRNRGESRKQLRSSAALDRGDAWPAP